MFMYFFDTLILGMMFAASYFSNKYAASADSQFVWLFRVELPLILAILIYVRLGYLRWKNDNLSKLSHKIHVSSFARIAAIHDAFVVVNESKGQHAIGQVIPEVPCNVPGTEAYKLGLLFTTEKKLSVVLQDQTFHPIDLTPYRIEKGFVVRFRRFYPGSTHQTVGDYYGIDQTAGLEIIVEP